MLSRIFIFLALLVAPVAAQAQGQPVVGIVELDDLTNTGQAETFSTMIETALISSGKFRVIERTRLARLLEEQGLANGGVVTTNTPGRTGGFEGVDYLIYGTITGISAVNRQDIGATVLGGLLGGARRNSQDCHNTKVRMEADIRITDTNTGEVRYASRISEEQQSAAVCGGGAQIDSNALMRAAADKIATGLTTAIYPIQIAAVQGGGTVILNFGEGAVQRGDYLMVYGESMEIPDPSGTGMIKIDGEQLGAIQVTDVQSAFSRAQMVTEFAVPPAVGTIARPVSEDVVKDLERAQRRRR
tara:strand:- start:55637 stop:56539 length:903 start_codon:yes stop_codon:yes gene_type:complete